MGSGRKTRYDRKIQVLAACLPALAGYVDAIGFIKLGGFFVAFMSGNSTQLAVGLAQRSGGALTAASLVGAFVIGVILGSLAGQISAGRRRRTVLLLVAALLACAAGLGGAGTAIGAAAAMALAMGAENAVFEHEGDVHIGLTYMTGTLVKMGQRIAAALTGGARVAWLPISCSGSG